LKRSSAGTLLAAAIGCSRLAAAPPAPAPRAVEPSSGLTNADVAITVRGAWFVPLVVQRVGGGGGVDVRADFRAWLGGTELREVRWFAIDEVRAALREENPDLRLPPPISIARVLIEHWLALHER